MDKEPDYKIEINWPYGFQLAAIITALAYFYKITGHF